MTDEPDPMADAGPMDDPDRCTATASSTGERCKQPAIPGGNVCRFHGGSAPQVKAKAQERLDRMADSTTAEMESVLDDLMDVYERAPPEDRPQIAAELRKNWKLILDRTGHGPSEKREHEDVTEGEGGFGPTIVYREDYEPPGE